MEQPREADRLRRQVRSLDAGSRGRGVPLVEDEVEHLQDDPQSLGALVLRREVEPRSRVP